MKKKSQSGFTLIELLVVIAIIGILASVVLASLNSARNKGADAATKAQLANARAQAELYYDTNSNYTSACTSNNGILPMYTAALSTSGGNNNGNAFCSSAANTWVMVVPLKVTTSSTHWCVDSTGASKGTNTANSVITACP